jgi:hypothetical protein
MHLRAPSCARPVRILFSWRVSVSLHPQREMKGEMKGPLSLLSLHLSTSSVSLLLFIYLHLSLVSICALVFSTRREREGGSEGYLSVNLQDIYVYIYIRRRLLLRPGDQHEPDPLPVAGTARQREKERGGGGREGGREGERDRCRYAPPHLQQHSCHGWLQSQPPTHPPLPCCLNQCCVGESIRRCARERASSFFLTTVGLSMTRPETSPMHPFSPPPPNTLPL